jgi:CBS-domain-containing membrane protein
MVSAPHAVLAPRLTLCANTAEELMTPNPVSVRSDATVQELIVLLTDKGIAAAPVIDEAGQPVGVVSRADVLAHDREAVSVPEYYTEAVASTKGSPAAKSGHANAETHVRDIMTPVLFSVRPDTPAARVVEEMLAMKVHRLFVIDDTGVLVGVVSTLDILRHLQPECME